MTDHDEAGEALTQRWARSKARLNPTVAAFMRRGLDSSTATALQAAGHTVASLKQASETDLEALGLIVAARLAIRQGARADIPFENLARVLWANRWTCCVCRMGDRAIVVHHIRPWAQSQDHSEANLAVLCLEHHARAHTTGDLEQNLTERRLRDAKERWEAEVRHLDAKAILQASRVDGFDWWWFNHARLHDLAMRLNVDPTRVRRFAATYGRGLVDDQGRIATGREHLHYLYGSGDGSALYAYMSELVEHVLGAAAVFNISEDLDPGFLQRVVSPGDIVLIQGRHYFKNKSRGDMGLGQVTEVRRQANGVRASFTIDRWEATSTSAWAAWLHGVHSAASVVRVVEFQPEGKHLHLRCTGLAIGFELEGLSNRSYVYPTWPSQREDYDEEDDVWLTGRLDDFA